MLPSLLCYNVITMLQCFSCWYINVVTPFLNQNHAVAMYRHISILLHSYYTFKLLSRHNVLHAFSCSVLTCIVVTMLLLLHCCYYNALNVMITSYSEIIARCCYSSGTNQKQFLSVCPTCDEVHGRLPVQAHSLSQRVDGPDFRGRAEG